MKKNNQAAGLAAILAASFALQDNRIGIFPYHRLDHPQPEPEKMVRLNRKKRLSPKGSREAARRRRQIERGILKVTP